MRNIALTTAALCFFFAASCAAARAQIPGRLPFPYPTPIRPQPTEPSGPEAPGAPTMKKPAHVEVAPSHQRRTYDAAHDATYLNVDIPLATHTERKVAAGALAFEGRDLLLVFQLAYAGKRTDDLRAAYLVLETTYPPAEPGDRLANVRHIDLGADPYEYAYDRTDYKAGAAEQSGAAGRDAPALKREIAVFKMELEDLQHIADATRLELKLGAETYTVKSPQLADLRHVIVTGDKQ